MTPVPLYAPRWIRVVSAVIGGAALVLSGFSFYAPHLLFGADAYHVLVRVATGLLGAMAGGLGVTAVVAAADGNATALRTVMVALFIATALIPPVVLFNIGAFNQADPTGWRAFGVAGGVILVMSLPVLLSLRVLNRLRRATHVRPAPPARPGSQVVRTIVK